MKPYELHTRPPVTLEVKYGMKVSTKSSSYDRPQRLEHFRVVRREKGYKETNWKLCEEVHEKLGGEPKRIPIVLLSDDMQENMHMMRELYGSGRLKCSAPYGSDVAMRRFPPKGSDLEKDVNGECAPYEVECNKECPYWNMKSTRKTNGCNISSKLFFKLRGFGDEIDSQLCILRMKGVYAQSVCAASMKMLHEMTQFNIIANLPLDLCIHTEPKTDKSGKMRFVPMISVQPSLAPIAFMEEIVKEYERRCRIANMFETDIVITSGLGIIANHEAVGEMYEEEITEEPDEIIIEKEADDFEEIMKDMPAR